VSAVAVDGALLVRLVDHAALFPPAAMALPDAIAEDRWARATPEARLLGRFLVPASGLAALVAAWPDRPALGVVADGASLEADLARITVPVETVEAKVHDADAVAAAADRVGDRAALFCELALGDGLDERVAACAAAGVGAKVRCGGAAGVPSVADLGAFVAACRAHGVTFKATAGLHHAVFDGTAHGFLNLLAAAGGHAELLGETDAGRVVAAVPGLDGAAVRALFAGYGSCSFREPVADLRALGLL
jgi:hypothetical protein